MGGITWAGLAMRYAEIAMVDIVETGTEVSYTDRITRENRLQLPRHPAPFQ